MNFLLTKKFKTLLLEKENYFGGRAINIKFHGETIKLGAGIGALDNKHLLHLLSILKISYQKMKSNINLISDKHINMKQMIMLIKKKYKSLSFDEIKYLSSKEFIIKYFGKDFFNTYSTYTEYTDFFDSSIESYIKYYPIDDHIPSPYTILFIDWMLLIKKLIIYIKKYNQIKKNYEVKSIVFNKDTNTYLIDNKYETKNIIFAVTINSLSKLIKNNKLLKINYNEYIGYIPFVRIYTYHKNGHNLNIDRYNILDSKLQKIIIISDKILMISYSDNNNALYWNKYSSNTKILINKIQQEIKKILNQDIIIDDVKYVFWNEGIHYYKPKHGLKVKEIIKKIVNPINNIFICGEMLSLKQGWVEGAIQSADYINKIIISRRN